MAESIFTQAATIAERNDIIGKMTMASTLGLYSTYITNVKLRTESGKILDIKGNDNISETLSTLSADEKIVNELLPAITKHIEDSAIAIVGIPNYICPTCQTLQKQDGEGAFKHIIPFDVVSLFFELSGFKLKSKIKLAQEANLIEA
jgi:rubrerythrin